MAFNNNLYLERKRGLSALEADRVNLGLEGLVTSWPRDQGLVSSCIMFLKNKFYF